MHLKSSQIAYSSHEFLAFREYFFSEIFRFLFHNILLFCCMNIIIHYWPHIYTKDWFSCSACFMAENFKLRVVMCLKNRKSLLIWVVSVYWKLHFVTYSKHFWLVEINHMIKLLNKVQITEGKINRCEAVMISF